jgi:CRP-like cAMP-binding protein
MDAARVAAIPLFAGLSQDDLEVVARLASEQTVEAGATLTTEGDFGHALYAIESGTGEVTSDGQTLGSVGPGDVVGEVAVLASGRRTATVTATSPMQVLAVFKRDVWALERTTPEVASRLRDLLSAHLGT